MSFKEAKLISELSKRERKLIGRKVLNATLQNAPEGTKIDRYGNMILSDGSRLKRTGHGRGRNSQYSYESSKDIADLKTHFEDIQKQIKADEARPEFKAELATENLRQDEQRHPSKISKLQSKQVLQSKSQNSPQSINTSVPNDSTGMMERLRAIASGNALPSLQAVPQMALDTYNSVDKLRKQAAQYGTGSSLEDAGLGVMEGLADTTGSVLDLGGLVRNRLADSAHDSAKWWKDKQNIPNSEAGSVGSGIGSEAVAGVAGGLAGRGIGSLYKRMKQGGEGLRERVAALAEKQSKEVMPKFNEEINLERITGGKSPRWKDQKMNEKVGRLKQKIFEDETRVAPRESYIKALAGTKGNARSTVGDEPYSIPFSVQDKVKKISRDVFGDGVGAGSTGTSSHMGNNMGVMEKIKNIALASKNTPHVNVPDYEPTVTRLGNAVTHNIKRRLDSKGMMKANDNELNDLFNAGYDLKNAQKIQQDTWNQLPYTGMNVGAGLAVGMD